MQIFEYSPTVVCSSVNKDPTQGQHTPGVGAQVGEEFLHLCTTCITFGTIVQVSVRFVHDVSDKTRSPIIISKFSYSN